MKINVNAPINDTSYGYVSSYFISEMVKKGVDLRHIPIGPSNTDQYMSGKLKGISDVFYHDADCLKIWHQDQLNGFTGKGRKIGFSIFELEDFSDKELNSLRYPDELIVCSEWAKQTLDKFNLKSNVVPLGYDPEIFKPASIPNVSTTVFCNIGKWEVRKGHDLLIKAFEAAFTIDDDVLLVMCPTNRFLREDQLKNWEKIYLSGKMGKKVQLIPRLPDQKSVYNIIEQVHCGVFPARAEGWNLEALEMLASGRHLIITDCTGHKEFVNSKNSKLISMDEKFEPAFDGVFFNGTRKWRRFGKDQFDQLVSHLREFHKNRPEKINQQGVLDTNKFTWSNSTDKLIQVINNA